MYHDRSKKTFFAVRETGGRKDAEGLEAPLLP